MMALSIMVMGAATTTAAVVPATNSRKYSDLKRGLRMEPRLVVVVVVEVEEILVVSVVVDMAMLFGGGSW